MAVEPGITLCVNIRRSLLILEIALRLDKGLQESSHEALNHGQMHVPWHLENSVLEHSLFSPPMLEGLLSQEHLVTLSYMNTSHPAFLTDLTLSLEGESENIE